MFHWFPLSLLSYLANTFPNAHRWMPDNRIVNFKKYLGSLSVTIDTNNPVERKMLSGTVDTTLLIAISKVVKDGDYCLDIGADAGPITLLLGNLVGPSGKVLSVESRLSAYDKLRRNVLRNPCISGRINTFNISVVNKMYPQAVPCLTMVSISSQPDVFLNTKKNRGQRLDDFVGDLFISRINFIRICATGMENDVISSGTKTFAKYRPVVFLDYATDIKRSETKNTGLIRSVLEPLGYTFFKIDEKGRFGLTEDSDNANLIALPKQNIAKLVRHFGRHVFKTMVYDSFPEVSRKSRGALIH
jgi:FkbM family methyltransferase